MIIVLATASVSMGLQGTTGNGEMIVAAEFPGSDESTLVAANQTENERP